jgi:hypothetical protein
MTVFATPSSGWGTPRCQLIDRAAVSLVGAGLQMTRDDPRLIWKRAASLLSLGMVGMWLLTSLGAWLVLDLPLGTSELLLSAVRARVDPDVLDAPGGEPCATVAARLAKGREGRLAQLRRSPITGATLGGDTATVRTDAGAYGAREVDGRWRVSRFDAVTAVLGRVLVDGRRRRTIEVDGERRDVTLSIDPREQSQRVHRVGRMPGSGAPARRASSR